MKNGNKKLKKIRKKPKVKQLNDDKNGWFSYQIEFLFTFFGLFSLKRKQRSNNKKKPNGNKANDSDESDSSSDSKSEDEEKEKTTTTTEEKQPEKAPTPPPPGPIQKQPHEKADIRQHLRHRKSNSSDDEQTETTN